MRNRRAYGTAAAVVLFAAAALEFAIILSDHAWTRFSTQHNNIVGAMVASFFVISGVAILLRNEGDGMMRTAFALGVASTLALFAHALVGLAVVYLPVAFIQAFLLFNTFKGTRWERRERQSRSEAQSVMRWS